MPRFFLQNLSWKTVESTRSWSLVVAAIKQLWWAVRCSGNFRCRLTSSMEKATATDSLWTNYNLSSNDCLQESLTNIWLSFRYVLVKSWPTWVEQLNLFVLLNTWHRVYSTYIHFIYIPYICIYIYIYTPSNRNKLGIMYYINNLFQEVLHKRTVEPEPGGRLNKKDGLTRYGNSHVKDKTS